MTIAACMQFCFLWLILLFSLSIIRIKQIKISSWILFIFIKKSIWQNKLLFLKFLILNSETNFSFSFLAVLRLWIYLMFIIYTVVFIIHELKVKWRGYGFKSDKYDFFFFIEIFEDGKSGSKWVKTDLYRWTFVNYV